MTAWGNRHGVDTTGGRAFEHRLEIGIPGDENEYVETVLDGFGSRVDGQADVNVAAGGDDLEPACFGRLDEFRGGVFVKIQAGDRKPAFFGGEIPEVVEVDIELIA